MTLRERIQEAISQLHAEMDFHDVNRRLMSEQASLHDYLRFLTCTYGFITPIERALSDEAILNDLARRQIETVFRAHLLEQDLMTLGKEDEEIKALPLMNGIPRAESLPQAMALLYVLNGSILGGLVIARQVKKQLKLDQRGGARFLNPYPNPRDAAALFDRFIQKLNSFARNEGDEKETVEQVLSTFKRLNAWIKEC